MRATVDVLLLALMQGATATEGTEVVNPYTDWGRPPPDYVACSSYDDCESGGCTNVYCQEDSDNNWCMEKHPPEAVGVPASACDDPTTNGFIKCQDGLLYRHCSPSNRDGGMYYTTDDPSNYIVNPYTNENEPPPEHVACANDDECSSESWCEDPYCDSGFCMEQLTAEYARMTDNGVVNADAVANPKAYGFLSYREEDGKFLRYCSIRNRNGGMFDATNMPPLAPSPSPPPTPDFANQTEGQLLFGACALIFILVVGTVRFSLGLSLLAHLPASHADRWTVLPAHGRWPTYSTCAGRWIPISSRSRRPTRARTSKV